MSEKYIELELNSKQLDIDVKEQDILLKKFELTQKKNNKKVDEGLKDLELRTKEAELDFRKNESLLKSKEIELKSIEILYKDKEKDLELKTKEYEHDLKKCELELKKCELEAKKHDIELKRLENERFLCNNNTIKKINYLSEKSILIKNLEQRFKLMQQLSLNFSSKTDIKTITEISKLLGDSIDPLEDKFLTIAESIIQHNTENYQRNFH